MIGDIRNIVLFQSLNPDEIKTGEDLYNDVIKRRIELMQPEGDKMNHIFWNINSLEQFWEILDYYIFNSRYMNGGILFHFEIHGEEKRKGLVLSDGSLVDWEELISKFRKINIGCCNKLFITMATCFGRFLYQGIFPNKKSPYCGYISAVQKVSSEEIIETFHLLFEKLISTRNIVKAYEHIEKAKTNFYYKDMEAIFEENFKMSENDLRSSKQFREEAFRTTNERARTMGVPELTTEDEERAIEHVLRDLYHQRKADFFFGDCE